AEVNAAADNDDRHAQRANCHDNSLGQDELNVRAGQKMWPHGRAEAKQTCNQQQSNERTEDVEQTAGDRGLVEERHGYLSKQSSQLPAPSSREAPSFKLQRS